MYLGCNLGGCFGRGLRLAWLLQPADAMSGVEHTKPLIVAQGGWQGRWDDEKQSALRMEPPKFFPTRWSWLWSRSITLIACLLRPPSRGSAASAHVVSRLLRLRPTSQARGFGRPLDHGGLAATTAFEMEVIRHRVEGKMFVSLL